MPKTTAPRTFTGCWTCRRRNVRCDTSAPTCSQCKQARIECEGYDLRLVWVDAETGGYVHEQRRAYPCHRTWAGHPQWTRREISRMIDRCKGQKTRLGVSPFLVFSQHESDPDSSSDCGIVREESTLSQSSGILILDEHLSDESCRSPIPLARRGENNDAVACETSSDNADNLQLAVRNGISLRKRGGDATPEFAMDVIEIDRLVTPSQSPEERRLLHHFVTATSSTMVPVDGLHNPWKSIYPLIASRSATSPGVRSLHHALLAQSAYHLINLLGIDAARPEKAQAGHHYGRALRELRRNLRTFTVYEEALAALLAIPLAEHVFRGDTDGWHVHYAAAIEFVCQHAPSRPWTKSIEAWTVSQSFALEYLILQTSKGCRSSSSHIPASMHNVLDELLDEPGFGYTHGGTGHIFRMIYQIRCLEEDVYQEHPQGFTGVMNAAMQTKLSAIIRQLEMPIEDQVDLYVKHQETYGVEISRHMRTSIHLHIELFTVGVELYLLSTVLRCPPCSVREKVDKVLTATADYIALQQRGSFSIWPVFMAATQAYTPEAHSLATYCLQSAEDTGAANRRDVHRLVCQVWFERQLLADTLRCDPGGLFVDWREVMKGLDLNVLLL